MIRNWFNNLKVSQKLMLISFFFLLPDSLMLYMVITGINENIRFAQWEKKGNEYQRPLEDLLEYLPQHRFLAERVLRGDGQAQDALARKQAEMDKAFAAFEAVDARIGADLQFTDEGLAKRKRKHYRARIVREEWEELKRTLPQLDAKTCVDKYLHLTADVRTMITHAGDLSNLILDPDLDSYYLMDITLLALPQTQDRLAAVMACGESVLRRRELSSQDRVQLSIYASLLKEADLERVKSSTQTALNEDANFHGASATLQMRVPPLLQEYKIAAEAFIGLTTRLAESDRIEMTAEEYLVAGNQAREASFCLWRVASEELDTLLQKRIEKHAGARTLSLRLTALALLAATALVTFITRSISGPLRRQAAALKTANQGLESEIAERKQAEADLKKSERELQLEIRERTAAQARLEQTHCKLLEVSRQAGMAEVATGVLHNVGNALNSVNVSATIIADCVQKSKAVNLSKAVALLREHGTDLSEFFTRDAKGKQLPGYLQQLGEHLIGEQQAVLNEVESLRKDIEHIKDIVAMQQSYAKISGVAETVKASELADDSLRMNASSLSRHDIRVVREYGEGPILTVEKHKVLQVLVNLLRNAKYACDETGRTDKQLTLRITPADGRVRFSVIDNGIGISSENLTRIFAHGFTTKWDGHGFGLHSGALAAMEMGGKLTAQSEGPRHGATFILELPLNPPAPNSILSTTPEQLAA